MNFLLEYDRFLFQIGKNIGWLNTIQYFFITASWRITGGVLISYISHSLLT
jgi:hypothetical protein